MHPEQARMRRLRRRQWRRRNPKGWQKDSEKREYRVDQHAFPEARAAHRPSAHATASAAYHIANLGIKSSGLAQGRINWQQWRFEPEHAQPNAILQVFRAYSHSTRTATDGRQSARQATWQCPDYIRSYVCATDFKLVMRLSRSTCALAAQTLSCCSAVFPSHVADWSRTRNRVLACTAISWLTTSARSPHASRDTRIRCLVNVTKSAHHPSL